MAGDRAIDEGGRAAERGGRIERGVDVGGGQQRGDPRIRERDVTERLCLRQGATGAAVTTLQYALRAKGYSITIDGIFGSGTATVVKTYQRTAGLTVDGIVGPATWGKVLPVLRSGATGYAVRGQQVELRAHGHSVTVDGQFGPATQAAVIAYQKANRLTADGIVGLQTWGSLVD